MVRSFIALGANLGEAVDTVRQAMRDIASLPQTTLVKKSSLYCTAPVDSSGPDYINAVVEISTALSAVTLLHKLQAIERGAGRLRPYRNAPRTLDLDILAYGDEVIDTPELTVPHPRMGQRAFVLVPLAEIDPGSVTPEQLAGVQGQSIRKRV
jgi:2-amino-4-hydroxy-6-hydroxymethyldihydropteridine diphosphokinase